MLGFDALGKLALGELPSSGPSPDANVNITGVSATAAVGAVSAASPDATVSISGVAATGSAGTTTQSAGATVGTGDPYFASTVLGLHMDGVNAGTSFPELTGKTVTRVGTPTTQTGQKKFGTASVQTSLGNYLTVPDSTDFDLGTGDFTIEAWIYPTASPVGYSMVVSKDVAGDRSFFLGVYSSTGTSFSQAAGAVYDAAGTSYSANSSTSAPALNAWSHIAFVRSAGRLRTYVNGATPNGFDTNGAITVKDSATTVKIGAFEYDASNHNPFIGYIDDVRITRAARYTGLTFTVPAAPFSDAAGMVVGSASATGSVGTVTASASTNASISVTGVSATGSVGTTTQSGSANTTVAGDSLWNSVVLATHFDGTNGSTTFTDLKGKALTANGNAQISTTQSKFGGASAKFDGTADWVSTPGHADFRFGTGDFCVDGWFYLNSIGANGRVLFDHAVFPSNAGGWQLYVTSAGLLEWWTTDASTYVKVLAASSQALSAGNWYYIEASRVTGTLRLFVNGNLAGSGADATTYSGTPALLTIGAQVNGRNANYDVDGYIDDFRITKGAGRHTSAYTAPTTAFLEAAVNSVSGVSATGSVGTTTQSGSATLGAGDPYFANVVLGMHMDGTNGGSTFTDIKGATVSRVGTPTISTVQSKFGGASGVFNGVDQYLTLTGQSGHDLGSGDFTVEAQIRLSAYASADGGLYVATIMSNDRVVEGRGWYFEVVGTASSYDSIRFGDGAGIAASGNFSFALNTWYHVECVRTGNTLYMFVNGNIINGAGNTRAGALSNGSANTLKIGARASDATYMFEFPGYLDEVRLTKGIARHTANFTAPTAAFPDSAGTPLTGAAATGTVGTVTTTANASTSITGASSTGSVGTTTQAGNAITSVSGVAATGSVGTATADGGANPNAEVSVSGVNATGSVGTTTQAAGATVAVTGVAATTAAGTTTNTGAANFSATGVGATGSVGAVSVSVSKATSITGVSATGSVGTTAQTASATKVITGAAATGSVGTSTNTGAANYTVTGVSATGSVGTVTAAEGVNPNATVSLTGVTATGSAGTTTQSASATTTISGTSATGSAGTVGKEVAKAVTGVAATGSAGTASAVGNATVVISGVSAVASVGEAVAAVVQNAIAAINGVGGTGFAGLVSAGAVDAPPLTPTQYRDAVAALTVTEELFALLMRPDAYSTSLVTDVVSTQTSPQTTSTTSNPEITCTN